MTAARAIVSIHDVRPSTLSGVLEVAALLERADVRPVTLLVVPGVAWDAESLDTVRDLIDRAGYGVAGHGWHHVAPRPASLPHRIHAMLISRDQAEHLSRSEEEVAQLVARCHEWFRRVDLPQPELYVPPAWALGRLPRSELAALPFRWYELLHGCVSAADGALRIMPLVGFEADTRVRALALRVLNPANLWTGAATGRPLRVAIHPWDLRHRLAAPLRRLLERQWRFTTVEAEMEDAGGIRPGPHRARTG